MPHADMRVEWGTVHLGAIGASGRPHLLHCFTIDEADVHAGDTETGGVAPAAPGTHTYYCSAPGHREAGMQGTLTVM